MKKLTYLWAFSLLTAAGVATAQDAKLKAKAGDSTLKVEADADVDQNKNVRVDVDKKDSVELSANARVNDDVRAVQNSNKASGLLGMEVRNQNNEKLGEIKDIVLDLKSGKLSYAVLAVGGFLGLGEKLVAIPVNAFTVSEDQGYLTVNADKAKVQAAVGFPATNWPHPEDPKMSTYWLTTDSSTGAPASVETDRARRTGTTIDIDRDRKADRRLEVNVDDDKNEKLYTDTKDRDLKAKADVDVDLDRDRKSITARTDADLDRDARSQNWKMLEGEVRSIDAGKNMMTIRTSDGQTREVYLDDATAMRLGREQVVRLNDYKPGYSVRVEYEGQGGKLMARRIIRTDGR